MDCPNLPQQPANPFQCSVNKPAFGRGFGGAGGIGGRGVPGGGRGMRREGNSSRPGFSGGVPESGMRREGGVSPGGFGGG
eukprot:297433-Rhodomonas_salina.1